MWSVAALLAGIVGGAFGVGTLVVMSGWTPGPARVVSSRLRREGMVSLAMATLAGGGLALLLTGWLVSGLAGAGGGYLAARAWAARGQGARADHERIESLASWCEQLRDLLSADHGIIGTIEATVRTCPEPIRPQVASLSARLARQDPARAVRQFADELDDPSADLVASVLALATTRSSRTSELLSELATTIRDRAAMRLRVEADRAGARSEARFVVGFSVLVVVGLLVFGRRTEFLDAYDTVSGQLALAMVIGFFALGGWWMNRLTRFDRPARFLSVVEDSE
ncbi:hypothetical protein BH24ACT5_BH24ACT5_05210 [soil metagenome]